MKISVYNLTNGLLADTSVASAIAAVNRQITEDFEPWWSMTAKLRLETPTTSGGPAPERATDAVIYVWDEVNLDRALGFHTRNNEGVPYGFVFAKLVQSLGQNWSTILSHEALELIADPEANLLTVGPDPRRPGFDALFYYEVCDAVQGDEYRIDGVPVSNFVTPLYFTQERESRANDHLGLGIESFGVRPGGYVPYVDLADGQDKQIFGSLAAKQNFEAKEEALGVLRRRNRERILGSLPFGAGRSSARRTSQFRSNRFTSDPRATRATAGARKSRRPRR